MIITTLLIILLLGSTIGAFLSLIFTLQGFSNYFFGVPTYNNDHLREFLIGLPLFFTSMFLIVLAYNLLQ
jgi:hypothetical protein